MSCRTGLGRCTAAVYLPSARLPLPLQPGTAAPTVTDPAAAAIASSSRSSSNRHMSRAPSTALDMRTSSPRERGPPGARTFPARPRTVRGRAVPVTAGRSRSHGEQHSLASLSDPSLCSSASTAFWAKQSKTSPQLPPLVPLFYLSLKSFTISLNT